MLYLRPLYTGISLTPDEIYLRTLFGCIEMLKTGTTTIIDDIVQTPSLNEKNLEMIFKAYRKAGIRSLVTTHLVNMPMYKTIAYLDEMLDENLKQKLNSKFVPEDEILSYVEENLKKFNTNNSIQRYVLAPSGPQRCTIKLQDGLKNLSEKYNVPSICHVLETKTQYITGKEIYNKTLVEYLKDNGLLYKNLSLVHCVWVTDKDIELIADSGSRIIHNPASNLKLGSGIAPVKKFIDNNIPVGLGTDNTSSNDSLNVFELMKLTGLIHKVQYTDYKKWVGADESFRMATIEGAKCALMEDEIGTIELDKKADLVLLDIRNERFIPSNNYLNQIVYAENGSSVKTVMINGQVVVENGTIISFNEKEVLDEVTNLMPKVFKERKLAYEQAKDVSDKFKEAYFRAHEKYNN